MSKSNVISFRLTDDEYADLLLKISGAEGELMMRPSDFARAALKGATISVPDKELDEYRLFIAGKLSNNINQIARRLNTDARAGTISEDTYREVAQKLAGLVDEINVMLEPVREGARWA